MTLFEVVEVVKPMVSPTISAKCVHEFLAVHVWLFLSYYAAWKRIYGMNTQGCNLFRQSKPGNS